VAVFGAGAIVVRQPEEGDVYPVRVAHAEIGVGAVADIDTARDGDGQARAALAAVVAALVRRLGLGLAARDALVDAGVARVPIVVVVIPRPDIEHGRDGTLALVGDFDFLVERFGGGEGDEMVVRRDDMAG
jgi:hypothetical protein